MTYSSEIFEKPKNTYYIHNLMMHKSFSKFKIFIEMFCKNYKKKKITIPVNQIFNKLRIKTKLL